MRLSSRASGTRSETTPLQARSISFRATMTLPLALYCLLFAVAIVAPIRIGIISYLILSAVDFASGSGGIGILNAAKGVLYPLYLLWRLKNYSGHKITVMAPVAWLLFLSYVAIASAWSLFPLSAVKLVGELFGTFLICIAFVRATKAGYLSPSILLPVTVGILILGFLKLLFIPAFGGEPGRFSGFTPAQAYASLLVALYSLSLCTRTLPVLLRIGACAALFVATMFNGSRVWTLGLLAATLVGLLISEARNWLKIFGVAALILGGVVVTAESDAILSFVGANARTNRVADTITAFYSGNERSTGLGTYNFRRGLYGVAIQSIETSTITELVFGHGTSNGRLLLGHLSKGIGDPNRAVHNEWLRIVYEWGILGSLLWLVFIGSVVLFAVQGVRKDPNGYARPLLAYLPGFLAGLSTENILAGAGHAANIGLLLLIALASMSHRLPAARARLPRWARSELSGIRRRGGPRGLVESPRPAG
jgi:hypothetical protein